MLRKEKITLVDDIKKISKVTLLQKKLMRFLAVEMRLDKSKKMLIIADPNGSFKLIDVSLFKVIREFYLGLGFLKVKISGNYLLFLS